jgi:hypothetical protein
MTDTIEPGDLIRHPVSGITVAKFPHCEPERRTLIAKGPGWTRHDGSSVNPVPGMVCQVHGAVERRTYQELPSDEWTWSAIQFYRVTEAAPSQSPAPQPGWVATAELRFFENQGGMAGITFPSGWTHYVDPRTIDNLDWQPPPPPPWEPEIGKDADWKGDLVIVRGIFEGRAWLEDFDGDLVTVSLSDLSPPKGDA